MDTMNSVDELLDMDLRGGDDDWTPTPHGAWLARMIASHDLIEGKDVLELGAGLANHTILLQRKGAKSIVATEITESLLGATRENFERHCGKHTGLDLRVANWLNTHGKFDLVVSNPPFCQSGKQNRRYFIDSLILDGFHRLRAGGELIFVQSSMADIQLTLNMLDRNGYDATELGRTSGPFRDYYFEDPVFMREIESVEGGYEERDGVKFETLVAFHAKLRPWRPHVNAHLPGRDK
jgi:predicted RNA methylase